MGQVGKPGPVRVLHLVAGNLYGGVEAFLTTLARNRELAAGLEHHYAVCFEGRLSGELCDLGVPVHNVGPVRASRPWTVWGARRRLRAVIRREGIGLAASHGCWPHALLAPATASAKVPLVFWGHDIQSGRHWVERRAGRVRPDLVLANSEVTGRSITDHLFPDTECVVYRLPVAAPENSARLTAGRPQTRHELTTDEASVVVIQVSRPERWKGHAVLVEALGQLADDPRWTCWLVGGAQKAGEREYLQELEALAAGHGVLGRVKFLGQRRDVPRLLAAADIFCQPNTGPEPFGVVFIEALHAGLPVVATAIGGADEIVGPECGRLTPPGDAGTLADILSELIGDEQLRGRLGQAGPERAEELCDPETQLRALEGLLRGCLAGGFGRNPRAMSGVV